MRHRSKAAFPIAAASLLMLAETVAASGAAHSNLLVEVGPGVNATIDTAGIFLSCSDDARCRFEVPPNATYELIGRGPRGHALRWAGCTAQPAPERCRVQVGARPVSITVR